MLNSVFNWSIAAIIASITMFSPISANNNVRANEVNEEEVAAKGCATNFENQGLIPFYYDGPSTSTKAEVEELSNWKRLESGSLSCDQIQEVACGLMVNPLFVDETDPLNHKLDPLINLIAEEQAEEEDPTYVTSIANQAGQILNRSR